MSAYAWGVGLRSLFEIVWMLYVAYILNRILKK